MKYYNTVPLSDTGINIRNEICILFIFHSILNIQNMFFVFPAGDDLRFSRHLGIRSAPYSADANNGQRITSSAPRPSG